MPTCFKFGGYTVYFWSSDGEEHVHVHVSKGRPSANATKIWLTSDGGLIVDGNSKIPSKDLNRIQTAILANRDMIIEQWLERFESVTYYEANGSPTRRQQR